MLVRIDDAHADQHIAQCDHVAEFTRLGMWINQHDNGMGSGVLCITNPHTGEVRHLCYC